MRGLDLKLYKVIYTYQMSQKDMSIENNTMPDVLGFLVFGNNKDSVEDFASNHKKNLHFANRWKTEIIEVEPIQANTLVEILAL